jgi:hypothetical protein
VGSLKPYYEDSQVTLYHGDCREATAWLDADVLVTDPPYGIAYNSGSRRENLAASIVGDEDTSLRDWALEAWGRSALVFGTWRIPRPAGTHTRLIWDTKGALGMGNLSCPGSRPTKRSTSSATTSTDAATATSCGTRPCSRWPATAASTRTRSRCR